MPSLLIGQYKSITLNSNKLSLCIGTKKVADNQYISVINEISNNKGNIVVNKLDNNLQLQWSKNYDLGNQTDDKAYDFIVDRDGNIVIVGAIIPTHTFVLKINSNNGTVIFAKIINNINNSASNRLNKIYQMSSNFSDDYIIMGLIDYPFTHYLGRIDKSGNTIWSKQYDCNNGNELPYSLAEASTGEIIIAGHYHNGSNFDHTVIKFNQNNGNMIKLQTFDLSIGSSFNGGFDDAVSIPGTNLVAFATVINNPGAPTRHGVTIYNTSTDIIQSVTFYNYGNNTRGLSIKYSPTLNKIVVGCFYQTNNDINLIFQIIDYNDLKNIKTYKPKNITFNNETSGYAYMDIDNEGNIIVSGFISKISNKSIGVALIGKSKIIDLTKCYDLLTNTFDNVNIPLPRNPGHSFSRNIVLNDCTPTIVNYNYEIKPLCEEKCIPTSKLFNLSYNKTIDTICHNQTSYSPTIKILNNQDDAIVNIVLCKIVGNTFQPIDSMKDNSQVRFNITNIGDIENYMIIGKKACSFNDTIRLQLKRYYLLASKIIHPEYFCKNERVKLSTDLLKTYFYPVEYRWWNTETGETLGTEPTMDITLTKSLSIALKIDDRCAPIVELLTTLYVAPNVLDSTIVINKLGCEPYATEFIHPTTERHPSIRTNFKWQWSINQVVLDSTLSEDGKVENNIPYLFDKANIYQLSVAMFLPNNKICYQFSDQITVLKKAIADFDYLPSAIDITDSSVKFVNKSSHAISYRWNTSDGISYTDVSPSHPINKIAEHWVQLIAYSENDCHDTILKNYTVYDIYRYYQPDGFSPNGDGYNDVWKPNITSAKEIELMIFNRWGEMILQSNDISCSWDGKYKDEQCQEGIYVFLLKIRTQKLKMHYYKGTIVLIR
ncbi:MAG: gliding motility-associated C-terminal domain-containing protein [Bacteroidota bacterium]|nr:gliding motility-associated C-terminal domain-containing protein [Bacteroidota bacterium]